MSEGKKARLGIIDDGIGFDEDVIVDVLALLVDPGGGLKRREAEGFLVLTNRRLVFATSKHGILVDLSMKEVEPPVTVTRKLAMARLVVSTVDGVTHTLVVNRHVAQRIAATVNRVAPS